MPVSKRQAVHWMFDIAVAFKAVDGVLEILAGYFLIFRPGWIGPAAISWAATLLTQNPASRFAHVLARWGDGLTLDTEHFASTYLIVHGAAKVFIAWGLIREKLWAFPTALLIFGLLVLYQIYRFAHTHSSTLAVLIVLDVAVCYLIWREYGFRRDSARAQGWNHRDFVRQGPTAFAFTASAVSLARPRPAELSAIFPPTMRSEPQRAQHLR